MAKAFVGSNPTPRTICPTLGSVGHLTEIINYGMWMQREGYKESTIGPRSERSRRSQEKRGIIGTVRYCGVNVADVAVGGSTEYCTLAVNVIVLPWKRPVTVYVRV